MKTEKTYKELQSFDNAATLYLIKNEYFKDGKFTDKATTKLVSNMKNVIKQAGKHFEEFKELGNDIQIDYCSVDEKTKVILYNQDKSYQFTKEKLKECNKAIKELAEKKVTVHTRITDGEFELTDEEKEAFSGILIHEIKKEEENV
ncbi:MAG: hypothetical protein AABY22_23085 [Nanoarchaeota archaeon]